MLDMTLVKMTAYINGIYTCMKYVRQLGPYLINLFMDQFGVAPGLDLPFCFLECNVRNNICRIMTWQSAITGMNRLSLIYLLR